MDRFVLTGAQWAKMEPHCLGKPTDPGRSGRNNRLFLEAVLWIVRTGSPGAIFLPCSATGARHFGDFAIGAKPTFSSAFSMLCRMNPRRITSGEEWKCRNGLAGLRGRGMPLPYPVVHLIAIRCIPSDSALIGLHRQCWPVQRKKFRHDRSANHHRRAEEFR